MESSRVLNALVAAGFDASRGLDKTGFLLSLSFSLYDELDMWEWDGGETLLTEL